MVVSGCKAPSSVANLAQELFYIWIAASTFIFGFWANPNITFISNLRFGKWDIFETPEIQI